MITLQELEALYNENGLSRQFRTLRQRARNAIHLQLDPCPDQDIPLGSSKLGGSPDLPVGMEWPCRDGALGHFPLSFIGQMNFAELKPFDLEDRLPGSGILYLFYDCNDEDGMPWGFDPKDADGKWVFYTESTDLVRLETPEALLERNWAFDSARLSYQATPELPDPFSPASGLKLLWKSTRDRLLDLMMELEEEVDSANKLLGYPDALQGDMTEECQIVTQGFYAGNPEGYAEARAKGAHENAHRWQLLLQVDSNEELGMIWGDCGRLYLWIPEEDLRGKDFSHTWLILQCG